jgi:hypothetical protein
MQMRVCEPIKLRHRRCVDLDLLRRAADGLRSELSVTPRKLPATTYNDICIRTSLLRSFNHSTEEGSPCI